MTARFDVRILNGTMSDLPVYPPHCLCVLSQQSGAGAKPKVYKELEPLV